MSGPQPPPNWEGLEKDVPISTRWRSRVHEQKRIVEIVFGEEKKMHAKVAVTYRDVIDIAEMLMQMQTNLLIIDHGSLLRNKKAVETIAHSALSVEVLHTSATDCILLVGTTYLSASQIYGV